MVLPIVKFSLLFVDSVNDFSSSSFRFRQIALNFYVISVISFDFQNTFHKYFIISAKFLRILHKNVNV